MSRPWARSLPYLAAWAAPAAVLFGTYLALGTGPHAATVGGAVGGLIGLFGHTAAVLVSVIRARRADERMWGEKNEPPERG